MKKIPAKSISYSPTKRKKRDVLYIVIHNTGNNGDTAENNGNFYKNVNTRQAGAHFFIDQAGVKVKSINLDRIAYSVGGAKYSDCAKTGGGKLYGKVTNANSVSIELCDIVNKEPSEAMVKSVWKVIKYIRKYCPNAQTVVRHFDVNGKHCPQAMMDINAWNKFQGRLIQAALTYK